MIVLSTSNDKLQLVTASAVTTDYSVVYTDDPARNALDNGQTSDGNITGAATTDIVSSPEPRETRTIKSIHVRNRHASSTQTVTLVKNVNGSSYHLTGAITLFAGEYLIYSQENGLQVFNATGRLKIANGSFLPPQLLESPAFQTNDITSTIAVGPGWCVASYMGKAPRNLDWATVRLRVTTAGSVGAVGEWMQVALAKGDINVGGNPTLTVVGFTSADGTLNTTGLKSIVVSVGANYSLNEGDNIWAIVGCSNGTGGIVPKFRAGLADDIQTGGFALVSNEPSAILGVATAFTILGATVSAPWFAVVT